MQRGEIRIWTALSPHWGPGLFTLFPFREGSIKENSALMFSRKGNAEAFDWVAWEGRIVVFNFEFGFVLACFFFKRAIDKPTNTGVVQDGKLGRILTFLQNLSSYTEDAALLSQIHPVTKSLNLPFSIIWCLTQVSSHRWGKWQWCKSCLPSLKRYNVRLRVRGPR